MAGEIDGLKQERDTYKDRFQRTLRESQTQREHLERSVANQSTQNILQTIRQMGSLTSALGSQTVESGNAPSASN